VNDPDFCAVASARLDPILAPRGFPYAADHNGVSAPGEPAVQNQDGVLFHCDGVETVTDLMARYPGWSARLRESYGPQEILCLDLWVKQELGYGPGPSRASRMTSSASRERGRNSASPTCRPAR
jgi:hypothetical protein